MGGLGSWLLALASPLARQVLQALGIGVVTYIGVDTTISGVLGIAKENWSGMPAEVANYLALAGVHTCLSMLAGAATTRVTLMTLKRFAKL